MHGSPGRGERNWNRLREIWRIVAFVLCAGLAAFGGSPAAGVDATQQAQESPAEFGLRLVDGGGMVEAPLLASLMEIQITGILARARVTQIFTNPGQETLEAVYVFPIPDQAAVDQLRLRVGDRETLGVVHETSEAQRIYREAESQGHVASLLSMQRSDVFTTHVTQIGPGETVEIEVGMQFPVEFQNGSFRLRFPLVVAPRFAMTSPESAFALPTLLQPTATRRDGNPAAFHVTLDAGFPIAQLESSSHPIEHRPGADGRSIVQLRDELTAAGRDFLLTWRPKPGQQPRTEVVVDEHEGERYALVMIIPPTLAEPDSVRLPRETIFVVDTSGSMSGGKLQQAREALDLALGAFTSGDKINVIRFSTEPTALFPNPHPVDDASLRAARDFVAALSTDGGTEMLPALELALRDEDFRDESPSDVLRQIVFITDGQVSGEEALYELIGRELGRSRLFTVGIGHAPNAAFMRHVATLGRGTFTLIPGGADVAEPMKTLLQAISHPILRDVRLAWDDPSVDPTRDVLPAPIPDLYAGEPLVVAARIGDSTQLHVSGWLRDQYLERTVSLDPSSRRQGTTGIDKEWARRRVEALTLFRRFGPSGMAVEEVEEDVRQEVVDLGLRHQLVTPFTSLVSVDAIRTAEPGHRAKSVLVPVSSVDSSAVAEELIVTSQAPLIHSTRTIVCGIAAVADEPMDVLHAGPWVTLARQPGVRVDRLGFGRPDGGAPAPSLRVVGRGGSTRADLTVEGLDAVALETIGPEPVYGVFRDYQEMSVNHGVLAPSDGVLVDLTTERGSNRWRSGLAARTAIDSGSGLGDRIRSDDRSSTEFGGPLHSDRAWLWIAADGREGERSALDGDASRHRTWSGMLRADGMLASSEFHWTLSCYDGERDDHGLGAGPRRAESASLKLDASSSSCSATAVYVSSADVFLQAFYSTFEAEGTVSGRGGETALWDEFGVIHGDLGGRGEGSERETLRVTGHRFGDGFLGGSAAHELTFGASGVDGARWLEDRAPGADGFLPVDGAVFGLGSTEEPFRLYDPAGSALLDERRVGLWLQDSVEWRSWTLQAGLRWDAQDLSLAESAGAPGRELSWTGLSPRLSVAKYFGPGRWTLLRLSWARFDERLRADVLTRTVPGLAGRAIFQGESLLDGGGAVWPNQTDLNLDSVPSDELALWLEQELGGRFAVSLGFVHRRRSDVAETRELVLDGGTLRPSVANDYVFDHTVSGRLPDGSAVSAPVFSLREGLGGTGSRLLTRGDRDIEYEGVTLAFLRRNDYRWSLRGHLHYGEASWTVPQAHAAQLDPTDLLGAGDRDGDPVVTPPTDLDFGFGSWLGGRWSAELAASVSFFVDRPWEFAVSGEIHAREGDPLPYYVWDTRSADRQARRVQVTESVDQFRLDDVLTADFKVVKVLPDLGPFRALASLDVLNLTNEGAVLVRDLSLSGPRAGLAEERVASRTVRFGLRLFWD